MIIKSQLFFVSMFGLFLLMAQCDKFSDIDFLTPTNFTLDSSSHEFDVKTKQGTDIVSIIVNGSTSFIQNYIGYQGIDSVKHYEEFSVKYTRTGSLLEITGKWFNIKQPDYYTTHISINESNQDTARSLIVTLGGSLLFSSDINIRQKGKEN